MIKVFIYFFVVSFWLFSSPSRGIPPKSRRQGFLFNNNNICAIAADFDTMEPVGSSASPSREKSDFYLSDEIFGRLSPIHNHNEGSSKARLSSINIDSATMDFILSNLTQVIYQTKDMEPSWEPTPLQKFFSSFPNSAMVSFKQTAKPSRRPPRRPRVFFKQPAKRLSRNIVERSKRTILNRSSAQMISFCPSQPPKRFIYSIVKQPMVEQPFCLMVEQPMVEQPMVEQPIYSMVEQPIEPMVEQPIVEEPIIELSYSEIIDVELIDRSSYIEPMSSLLKETTNNKCLEEKGISPALKQSVSLLPVNVYNELEKHLQAKKDKVKEEEDKFYKNSRVATVYKPLLGKELYKTHWIPKIEWPEEKNLNKLFNDKIKWLSIKTVTHQDWANAAEDILKKDPNESTWEAKLNELRERGRTSQFYIKTGKRVAERKLLEKYKK